MKRSAIKSKSSILIERKKVVKKAATKIASKKAIKKSDIRIIRKKALKKAVSRRIAPLANVATQYVLPLGNGWVVKTATATSFVAITDSKREAVYIARNLAKTKHSQLVVHDKDGKISIQENYRTK